MADKIDQLEINGTLYDIDLPPDATPSISGLTVSGNVSDGTTTKTMTQLLAGGGGGLTLLYTGTCSDIDDSIGTQIGSSSLYAVAGWIDAGNLEEEMIGSSHMNDKLYIEVINGYTVSSNIFPLTAGDGMYAFFGVWDSTVENAILDNYDEIKIYKLG